MLGLSSSAQRASPPACGGGNDEGSSRSRHPARRSASRCFPTSPRRRRRTRRSHTRTGRWLIRFSTTLLNIGDGDFVLRATRVIGDWTVDQDVQYSESGGKVYRTPATLGLGRRRPQPLARRAHRRRTSRPVRSERQAPETSDGHGRREGRLLLLRQSQVPRRRCVRIPGTRVSRAGRRKTGRSAWASRTGGSTGTTSAFPGRASTSPMCPTGSTACGSTSTSTHWFHEKRRDNNVNWVDFELVTQKNGSRAVTHKVNGPPIRLAVDASLAH